MSRIGKKIIVVPNGTEITIDGSKVTVKGKLGQLERTFDPVIKIEKIEEGVKTTPENEKPFARAMWGTVASHIANMIQGVNEGFKKELIIEGVGYRAEVSGNKITLKVGFSHDVVLEIPEDLKVEVEKNTIKVSGIDKERVGWFASKIRLVKKPEPYKGKGIRYSDEVIIRKEGKKNV